MSLSGTLPLASVSSASLHRGAEAHVAKFEAGRNTRKNLSLKSSNGSFNGIRMPVAPALQVAQNKLVLGISAMAKRDDQVAAIKQLSDEDIETKVVDLKGELFVLRCKQATRQEYKSSDFRTLRKEIARMLTIRREREIEKGINKRESRKLDRKWKKNIVVRPPASLASLNAS